MDIQTISVKGSKEWNEDALIINRPMNIYGVADGATSLVPYRSQQGETGGRRASQIVKGFFESVNEKSEESLENLAKVANKLLGEEMDREGIVLKEKENLWTTGLALIRVNKHRIEFVQAGDCMIIALYNDGSYRTVTRDQISYFDNETKKEWINSIEAGLSTQTEIRKRVEPMIKKQKYKINTMSGFSVLDGSDSAELYLENGQINRINLTSIIICTDGLFMHEERNSTNLIDPIKEIVEKSSLLGIEAYIDYLNAVEDKDPECIRFPRTKKSDDKTAVYIKF